MSARWATSAPHRVRARGDERTRDIEATGTPSADQRRRRRERARIRASRPAMRTGPRSQACGLVPRASASSATGCTGARRRATSSCHGSPSPTRLGANLAEELDLERLDVVGRLEAEDLGVERELGAERADDRVAGRGSRGPRPGRAGRRAGRAARTARRRSARPRPAGTTLSSAPCWTSTGAVICSACRLGDRSR